MKASKLLKNLFLYGWTNFSIQINFLVKTFLFLQFMMRSWTFSDEMEKSEKLLTNLFFGVWKSRKMKTIIKKGRWIWWQFSCRVIPSVHTSFMFWVVLNFYKHYHASISSLYSFCARFNIFQLFLQFQSHVNACLSVFCSSQSWRISKPW